jgi:hypothetical protein
VQLADRSAITVKKGNDCTELKVVLTRLVVRAVLDMQLADESMIR